MSLPTAIERAIARELEDEMRPLLERGADAYIERCLARAEILHGEFHIVTQADYVAQPLLCLRHAVQFGPVHILCEGGALFALLAQLRRR